MDKKRIAIIGGGACGLFTAAMLNNENAEVVVLEKNSKLGKKILASGNGKCNFTNIREIIDQYNNSFANDIINKFNVEKTLKQFSKMGLIYKHDDQGRCYPVSECSSSVLDCLKLSIFNAKIKLDCLVEDIFVKKDKCIVKYNGNEEFFDYVVCCSGNVVSNLGSYKAINYLQTLNLEKSDLKCSLAPLVLNDDVKSLAGVRVKCEVKLLGSKDNLIYKEKGEIIFKEDGISGIAIFNASSYINRSIDKKYSISLDISNGYSREFFEEYFNNKRSDNLLKGFLNDKLGEYLLKRCSNKGIVNISKVIENIKDLRFNVFHVSNENAQVCSGGIKLKEVDDNLRLKRYPFIYIGGELLDIDGVCGGYNLQFAWSSGAVIAQDIKRRINNASNI